MSTLTTLFCAGLFFSSHACSWGSPGSSAGHLWHGCWQSVEGLSLLPEACREAARSSPGPQEGCCFLPPSVRRRAVPAACPRWDANQHWGWLSKHDPDGFPSLRADCKHSSGEGAARIRTPEELHFAVSQWIEVVTAGAVWDQGSCLMSRLHVLPADMRS